MKRINRRNFIKAGIGAAGSAPFLASAALSFTTTEAQAAACDASKPPASALKYSVDATKSTLRTDARKTEFCYNCIQYAQAKRQAKKEVPKTGEDTCVLIPGCNVQAKGWCMVWVKAQ